MVIVLMRHGETLADLLNVYEGRADFDLTVLGIKQVQKTAKKLAQQYVFDKIYASPLIRAKHTTSIVSDIINCYNITYLDSLMEFNNGLLAGMNKEEANKLYPKDDNLPFDQSMYQMESLKEFRERATFALNTILKENYQTVLIVAHGGIINQLYQTFLNMPIPSYTQYKTKNAGYHVWMIDDKSKRMIIRSNQ